MKRHILLPFSGATRLHWWNALFLCLLKKNALAPQTADEEKLFYLAEVKYVRFGQLLSPEICALPIPARSGKLTLLENMSPWIIPEVETLLDEAGGVTLLISLASEMAVLEKRHGRFAAVAENAALGNGADKMSALHNAPALEWISLLIECLYQRNFTQKTHPSNFPLKIVLGYLPKDEPANCRFNEAYDRVLKRYLRTFFAAARVSLVRTPVQENPSRQHIEALAQELGAIIGEFS